MLITQFSDLFDLSIGSLGKRPDPLLQLAPILRIFNNFRVNQEN
jgi:hypothetical protein